jgi:hypothetical protein
VEPHNPRRDVSEMDYFPGTKEQANESINHQTHQHTSVHYTNTTQHIHSQSFTGSQNHIKMTENSPPPFFSMGLSTYKVPKEMFSVNRCKLIKALREAIPSLHSDHDIAIYLEGGCSSTRNDSDHEPIFRQESYFYYLFGVREPDHCGLIYLKSGRTVLFTPRLSQDYATIMGHVPTTGEIKNNYQVDDVLFTDSVEAELAEFCSATNERKVLVLSGTNTDSGKDYFTPTFKSKDIIVDVDTLFPVLAECRVSKSQMELDLIRHCTEITSLAHVFTMKHMKPGMMEYQGESLFRHYIYYNFGARNVGYTNICGCGPNAAVLHYGHGGTYWYLVQIYMYRTYFTSPSPFLLTLLIVSCEKVLQMTDRFRMVICPCLTWGQNISVTDRM